MNSDASLNNLAADDEISLLDLALTVAENLRLLIIGPIAAGLIALGVSSLLPKTFESVAILSEYGCWPQGQPTDPQNQGRVG